MAESDWELASNSAVKGGQGEVAKVRHKADGRVGAMKSMLPEHLRVTERRYRAQQEVNALMAIGGHGTPNVLETNAAQWQDKSVQLYMVMDWVEGRTLQEFVGNKPISLDQAIDFTRQLLSTIQKFHAIGIHHRDLKPHNIMVQSVISRLYVVDFGMSWKRPIEEDEPDHLTKVDQEIGNRFLRLPEFAPGHHQHSNASDLAMLVGLLFFMVTGQHPRILRNVYGQMPHESHGSSFSDALRNDVRFERLLRVFNKGFQENPLHRFFECQDLLNRLENLVPSSNLEEELKLKEEMDRLDDLFTSEKGRRTVQISSMATEANQRYWKKHFEKIQGTNYITGGQGPTLRKGGNESYCALLLSRHGGLEPNVAVGQTVRAEGEEIIAEITIDHGPAIEYFRGPISEPDALYEAVERKAVSQLAASLGLLHSKLKDLI